MGNVYLCDEMSKDAIKTVDGTEKVDKDRRTIIAQDIKSTIKRKLHLALGQSVESLGQDPNFVGLLAVKLNPIL
jgi:hypothetical protein